MIKTELGKVTLTPRGEWVSTKGYRRLDFVTKNGSSYVALKDNVNVQVTDIATWQYLAKQGESGDAPLLEGGYVTSIPSNEPARATITQKGVTEEGIPIFNVNLWIPRGEKGDSGDVTGATEQWVEERLLTKVDKINNKQLSTEDYTTEEKTKLGTIATGAQVNVKPDWTASAGSKTEILNKPTIISQAAVDKVYNDSIAYTDAEVDKIIKVTPTEKTKISNLPSTTVTSVYMNTSPSYWGLDFNIQNLIGLNSESKSLRINKVSALDSDVLGVISHSQFKALSNKYTKEETIDEINKRTASLYRVKGSVNTYEDLPTEAVEVGDVYNLKDTGANYVAISTTPEWDKLSETVDLSPYLKIIDADAKFVEKEQGKVLISSTELERLAGVGNYDDSSIKLDITNINTAIGTKVDKVAGKVLSTNDYTTNDKNIVSSTNHIYSGFPIVAGNSIVIAKDTDDKVKLSYSYAKWDTASNSLKNFTTNTQLPYADPYSDGIITSEIYNKIQSSTAYDDTEVRGLISGKQDKIAIERSQDITEKELKPNKFYDFGTVANLNLTLATPTNPNDYNEYMFQFRVSQDGVTLTLPSEVKGLEGLIIQNGYTYQCSILNNIALIAGVKVE